MEGGFWELSQLDYGCDGALEMLDDHTVSLGVMPTFEGGVSEKMNNQLALVEFF